MTNYTEAEMEEMAIAYEASRRDRSSITSRIATDDLKTRLMAAAEAWRTVQRNLPPEIARQVFDWDEYHAAVRSLSDALSVP